jgi:hypothetical protein
MNKKKKKKNCVRIDLPLKDDSGSLDTKSIRNKKKLLFNAKSV